MNIGKRMRLQRIFEKNGRAVIVAMDHAGIAGPMRGLEDPRRAVERMVSGGADGLLLTRGALHVAAGVLQRRTGVILRISGGFTLLTDPSRFEDRLISGVEAAIRLGADAVGVTVKFGHEREGHFMEQASRLADVCESWGMPLMIEIMLRGERLGLLGEAEGLRIAARSAFELGADFLKLPFLGTMSDFRTVVEGCPIPLLVLGGEKKGTPEEVFAMVSDAMSAGASGVAMGRNVWSHDRDKAMLAALNGLVHQGWSVQEAIACLNEHPSSAGDEYESQRPHGIS